MKKTAIILAIAMISTMVLVSCGKGNNKTDETKDSGISAVETTSETKAETDDVTSDDQKETSDSSAESSKTPWDIIDDPDESGNKETSAVETNKPAESDKQGSVTTSDTQKKPSGTTAPTTTPVVPIETNENGEIDLPIIFN